jgi:hypothetical protein
MRKNFTNSLTLSKNLHNCTQLDTSGYHTLVDNSGHKWKQVDQVDTSEPRWTQMETSGRKLTQMDASKNKRTKVDTSENNLTLGVTSGHKWIKVHTDGHK